VTVWRGGWAKWESALPIPAQVPATVWINPPPKGDGASTISERWCLPGAVNVASGEAVGIRLIVDQLSELAGVPAHIQVNRSLVRTDHPAEMCGDATLLAQLTGWRREIPLYKTLSDVLDEAARSS
jgi:nucleoside-diphosphate-sugar epimerase